MSDDIVYEVRIFTCGTTTVLEKTPMILFKEEGHTPAVLRKLGDKIKYVGVFALGGGEFPIDATNPFEALEKYDGALKLLQP